MAKTGYIDLTTAEEKLFYSVLRPADRFISARVTRKVTLLSARRKKGVSQKSLLPACSLAWSQLTTEEKNSFSLAGSYCNLNGWRLFVREYSYRVINNLPLVWLPSIHHQGLCGELKIENPASEIKIIQPHPFEYYISKKITGTKSSYAPFVVTERLVLPLQIGLTYYSDLVPIVGFSAVVGVSLVGVAVCGDVDSEDYPFAKFYAIVRRLYQGRNIDTLLEINLFMFTDWNIATAELSNVLGQYTSYSLYFHLYNLTGTVVFDNVKAIHTSQNWVRDATCQDIHQDFTRAFYQVPAHWSALEIPEGSFFESVYSII